MRVIGGTYRSRPLQAPAGSATRPTSDRLRETLFNVVAERVAGATVLDLYCGTGAVGIEALSRGAAYVLFVETAAAPLRALRANLRTLEITSSFEVIERPAVAAIQRLLSSAASRGTVDLVFLDPPYESAKEYLATLALLGSTAAESLLARDAMVVAEHATRSPLQEGYGRLRRGRTLRQGDATLSFFTAVPAGDAIAPEVFTEPGVP